MRVKIMPFVVVALVLVALAFLFIAIAGSANVVRSEPLTATVTDGATVELVAFDSYSRFYRVSDHGVVCYAVANSSSSYGGQAISCITTKGR